MNYMSHIEHIFDGNAVVSSYVDIKSYFIQERNSYIEYSNTITIMKEYFIDSR